MPYVHAFVDTRGSVHYSPKVQPPADQEIRLARKQNSLSAAAGQIRIQPTGDVLLVHRPDPDPYEDPSMSQADQHVQAWIDNVQSALEANPYNGVLVYAQESRGTMVDYRIGDIHMKSDIHIIAAFPQWAGHTIESITEGFPPSVPKIQTDRMTY
jgi:hypothetical protein